MILYWCIKVDEKDIFEKTPQVHNNPQKIEKNRRKNDKLPLQKDFVLNFQLDKKGIKRIHDKKKLNQPQMFINWI